MKIIYKHPPRLPNYVLAKIVNRNSAKVSYRCSIPNLKKAISQHNHRVRTQLNLGAAAVVGWSLPGWWLCGQGSERLNTGMTGNRFKDRFYKHNDTINDEHHKHHSNHIILNLKKENKNVEVKWKIIYRTNVFDPTTRKCLFCH